MDNYKETFETWDKVASLYQEKFMDLDLYNETYDLFCNYLNSDKSEILEIGCGPGNITKYLLKKRPDFSISGTDISPNMIELAAQNNPTADFFVMDARSINEIDKKYDGIICGFCLPYLSEIDSSKLISDCNILLQEGGMLYLSFVEGDESKSGFMHASSGDRTYFYYHDLKKLKQSLSENEFELKNYTKINYKKTDSSLEIHSIIIAKKKIRE